MTEKEETTVDIVSKEEEKDNKQKMKLYDILNTPKAKKTIDLIVKTYDYVAGKIKLLALVDLVIALIGLGLITLICMLQYISPFLAAYGFSFWMAIGLFAFGFTIAGAVSTSAFGEKFGFFTTGLLITSIVFIGISFIAAVILFVFIIITDVACVNNAINNIAPSTALPTLINPAAATALCAGLPLIAFVPVQILFFLYVVALLACLVLSIMILTKSPLVAAAKKRLEQARGGNMVVIQKEEDNLNKEEEYIEKNGEKLENDVNNESLVLESKRKKTEKIGKKHHEKFSDIYSHAHEHGYSPNLLVIGAKTFAVIAGYHKQQSAEDDDYSMLSDGEEKKDEKKRKRKERKRKEKK